MRKFIASLVIFAAGFGLCTVINGSRLASLAQATPANQAAPKVVWEYISTSKVGDLNKLGAQGWELVGISDDVAISGGIGSSTTRFYFKRAK